jgi:tripartite-type tricarboxylate transporter receptor subunit TctC
MIAGSAARTGVTRIFALAFMALLATALPAFAQEWPTKTVRFIVPFGPGATPDIIARLIADRLQTKLGATFVVENKSGASGNTGTDVVAKAPPDGNTIGISIPGPLAINTLLFSKLPYDPAKDLALITILTTQPSVLAVNANVPAANVAELVALLKREPGKYNFGSVGNGSLSHLAMEAVALKSGAQLVHIPYGSSPQAMTAVIRDDVHMAVLPAISVLPHAASGAVRMLAVTSAQRSPLLPDVPTLKEGGIDVEADAWNGLIAPAGTPEPVLAKIHDEVVAVLNEPDVRDKLKAQIMEPVGSTPAEFKARIADEIARWTPVIKAAGVKVN